MPIVHLFEVSQFTPGFSHTLFWKWQEEFNLYCRTLDPQFNAAKQNPHTRNGKIALVSDI